MSSDQESELVDLICGDEWLAAALRALAVFILGYVIPLWLFGHTTFSNVVQLLASLAAFVLIAVAIYRLLQSREFEEEESSVSLAHDTQIATQVKEIPKQWSIHFLQQIEWKHLAGLCSAIYKEKGFRIRTQTLDADGCIVMHLYQGNEENAAAIVRCRAWGDYLVGAEAVQILVTAMASEQVPRGFFMSAGGFTKEARALAKQNHITVIEGKLLLAMLDHLPAEIRQRLLNTVTDGDYTTPSCPGCGLKMITTKNDQGPVWSCRTYPKCKQTLAKRAVAA